MLGFTHLSFATRPDSLLCAHTTALREAFARIPLFMGRPPGGLTIEPLGGDTNRVYRIVAEEGSYVLRVPAAINRTLVDRVSEKRNARIAASVGVGAQLLFFDESDGLMLTLDIKPSMRMSRLLFRGANVVARATTLLRRLHISRREFANRLDPFFMIATYRSLAAHRGTRLPEPLAHVLGSMEALRDALWIAPTPAVACHGQPLPEHFLDTGAQMFLVDWEQAGMGDAMWDLACLSLEGDFDAEGDATMLRAYFGSYVPPSAHARMTLYKPVADVLWAVWELLWRADDDASAMERSPQRAMLARIQRCSWIMSQPMFAEALTQVRCNDLRAEERSTVPQPTLPL